jgi:hypothetical protein
MLLLLLFARKLDYRTTTSCHASVTVVTLLEGVQAGYHTQKATRASKAVSARSPGYRGREQH